jgi:transcriptional regulator with GAF, ATPase, and Fis domain
MMALPLHHTEDLQRLAELASRPAALEDVLERALHSLRAVIDYDLAVLFELRGEQLVPRAAAGPLADDRIRDHVLELSRFPTIRRALDTRQPIPLHAHDHAGVEGDPFDGVLDLPDGHSCMVVPLFAADRSLGLITLDRTVCAAYSRETVSIAAVYGQIVSIAMAFAEQAALLERYRRKLEEHNRLLREEVGSDDEAVAKLEHTRSAAMLEVTRMARQVAPSGLPVLIHGETGSGKEVLAHAIHVWSGRPGAFVKLNCAAMPENLVESELFGHVKGAFSGATKDRPGRFVTADSGTILLDEIGDMSAAVQAKLLRVLQEGTFEPVGSDQSVSVDVRVIAASHVDLERAVAEGRFREDLYYRLAVFPLRLPPLRDRLEDIVPMAQSILADVARRQGRGPWTLSEGARTSLEGQTWPGNVRQLVNVLERATILQPTGTIESLHLGLSPGQRRTGAPLTAANSGAPVLPLFEAVRRHLLAALDVTGGKIYGTDGAAALLGLKPTTLQSKLKRHGIDRVRD